MISSWLSFSQTNVTGFYPVPGLIDPDNPMWAMMRISIEAKPKYQETMLCRHLLDRILMADDMLSEQFGEAIRLQMHTLDRVGQYFLKMQDAINCFELQNKDRIREMSLDEMHDCIKQLVYECDQSITYRRCRERYDYLTFRDCQSCLTNCGDKPGLGTDSKQLKTRYYFPKAATAEERWEQFKNIVFAFNADEQLDQFSGKKCTRQYIDCLNRIVEEYRALLNELLKNQINFAKKG